MWRHWLLTACSVLSLACSTADSADPLPVISNAVEGCLRLSAPRARTDGIVQLLELSVEHFQSTAACGCKSGLLTYRVTELIGSTGVEAEIVSGRISGMKPYLGDDALLVTDTDLSVGRRGGRTLRIGCAAPE